MKRLRRGRIVFFALTMTVALAAVFTTARTWSTHENQSNTLEAPPHSIQNPKSEIQNRIRPPVHYELGPRGEPYLRFGALQPLPQAESQDAAASPPLALALADLNQDGIRDLLAATAEGTLLVYPGIAGGRFEPPLSFVVGTKQPRTIVTGDFNFDANVDVVMAGGDGFEVLYNVGDGSFLPPVQLVTTTPTTLVAEDFNRDGSPELVIAGTGGLTRLRGQRATIAEITNRASEADFRPTAPSPVSPTRFLFAESSVLALVDDGPPVALAAAELNGDDRNDLVMVDAEGRLAILYTDEQGVFSQPQWINLPSLSSIVEGSWSLAAADLNDDQLNDLVVSYGYLVTVLLNQGQGQFQPLEPQDFGYTIASLQAVRLNADYAVDLLLTTSDQRLATVLGDGQGGFNRPVDLEMPGGVSHVLAAQLDYDALTDLIVVQPSGQLGLVLQQAVTFVVVTECDAPDLNVGDGFCDAGANPLCPVGVLRVCTLRAAIQEANASRGVPNTILFADGLSTKTIQIQSALPALTDGGTTIDALTDPDGGPERAFPQAIVTLSGVQAGTGVDGLTIQANNCTIRGLAITRFTRDGIVISGGDFNAVDSNAIGTDANSSTGMGNSRHGVHLQNLTTNPANSNTIGPDNIISGNAQAGVRIIGANSNMVTGNKIGTNAGGTAAIANGGAGILVQTNATNNTIGGTTVLDRNLISGNAGAGVSLTNNASGNKVRGNFIGTNASGIGSVPNQGGGVDINQTGANVTFNNTIGAEMSGGIPGQPPGNIIAFNNLFGVKVRNTSGNKVMVNQIHDNSGDGVIIAVEAAAFVTNQNEIVGNEVYQNTARGVVVNRTSTGTGTVRANKISQNSIHTNGARNNADLGIDLVRLEDSQSNRVNPNDTNDPDSGPNDLLNFPEIDAVEDQGTTIMISGRLPTQAGSYTIEFFANDVPNGPIILDTTTGHGEGQVFIGSTTVTVSSPPPQGGQPFLPVVLLKPAGQWISATTIDPEGNTSEFARAVKIRPSSAPTITVTAPNGGETWTMDSLQTIQWTSSGVSGNVKIELSRNGGSGFETLFASEANTGSKNWTVTGPTTSQAVIKVSSVDDPSVSDMSDATFTISSSPPSGSITVIQPNGGGSAPIGQQVNIRWTSTNVPGNVKIELSRNGGVSYETLFASTANDGVQSWVITGPATTQGLIKISSVDNPAIFDTSDSVFTITQ